MIETLSSVFNIVLVEPFINVLVAGYKGLFFLGVPFALGFSIIILTIVIRFLIFPLTHSQLLTSKKMQGLAPHLADLKLIHKSDAKRLQQETMKLYKEHGINPASGCVLLLVQMPIIYGLYAVLNKVVHLSGDKMVEEVNKMLYFSAIHLDRPWDPNFFGLPLGKTPGNLLGDIGPMILLVPIITGALQFVQSKMAMPLKHGSKKDNKKKDDFATAFQAQSTYILPIMIGFFSFNFPIGLSLYWNTFSIFGIIQQYFVTGWGGLKLPARKLNKNGSKR